MFDNGEVSPEVFAIATKDLQKEEFNEWNCDYPDNSNWYWNLSASPSGEALAYDSRDWDQRFVKEPWILKICLWAS